MNNNTKKFMVMVCAVAGIFGLMGCGKKMDKAKTSSESTEFFKEIGTAEQENAEMTTNTVMQNAAVTTNFSPTSPSDSPSGVDKPSVQNIQQALKNANIYLGKIDGVLGPKTKKAIESFQEQNSLKADGKVGSKTWQKLKTYLNASAVQTDATTQTPQTTPSNSSSKAISD